MLQLAFNEGNSKKIKRKIVREVFQKSNKSMQLIFFGNDNWKLALAHDQKVRWTHDQKVRWR